MKAKSVKKLLAVVPLAVATASGQRIDAIVDKEEVKVVTRGDKKDERK